MAKSTPNPPNFGFKWHFPQELLAGNVQDEKTPGLSLWPLHGHPWGWAHLLCEYAWMPLLILISVMINSAYQLDWICNQLNSLWKDFMEASLEGADSPTEWVALPLSSPDRRSKGGKNAAFLLAVNPCRWAHLLCCCCCHASLTLEINFLQLSYVDWKPVTFREAIRLLSTILGLLRRPDTCTKRNGYWDLNVSDVQIAVLFMSI